VSYPNEARMLYSDTLEKLVLTNIVQSADPLTAEVDAACQTLGCDIRGVKQLGVMVNVTDKGAATVLFVKVRFSGLANPSSSTLTDWGFICVDNIDGGTGFSPVQEYVIQVDLANVNGVPNAATARRLCLRIEQISGLHASAIVWADSAVAGTVTFVQLGG
jgi:hypothetical protein